MNYLITGGTGLIGKTFIEALPKNTSQISVLTRDKENAKKLLGNAIHFIDKLSINDIEKSDVILNLAGEPIAEKRWSSKQKKKICQSRWHITQQLVDLIKLAKKPPSDFISASAIGIYGKQNNQPIDENHILYHDDFTHHVCSTWENIALNTTSVVTNKTRVAILRTGIVLDKNRGALAKMILPFKFGLGGKMGNGEQIMSWIHIDDMVNAISHIQKNKSLQGVINITAPYPVNNKQFSLALAVSLNRPCFFSTPSWLLKILLGEMAELLLFGQNVLPKKLIDSRYSFKYPTITKALTELINR